jgi:hypothetical protein
MRRPLFAGPLRQATKQPIYARKVYVFADFGRMLFPNCNTQSLSKTQTRAQYRLRLAEFQRAFMPWGEAIGPDKQRDRCCRRALASALCALPRWADVGGPGVRLAMADESDHSAPDRPAEIAHGSTVNRFRGVLQNPS